MNTRRPLSSTDAGPRCLIWIAPGYDVPLDLLDGLRQRHVQPREVSHAPLVMAELAVGAPGYDVLVIVDPEIHPQADALVEAVQTHFPHIRIWRYSRTDRVRLTRWNGHLASTARSHAPSPTRQSQTPSTSKANAPEQDVDAPSPASAHASAPGSDSAAEPADRPGSTAPTSDGLLSEEELAMLLGNATWDDSDPESSDPPPRPRQGGNA